MVAFVPASPWTSSGRSAHCFSSTCCVRQRTVQVPWTARQTPRACATSSSTPSSSSPTPTPTPNPTTEPPKVVPPANGEGWTSTRTKIHTLVVDPTHVDGSSPGVHFETVPELRVADLAAIIYQGCPDAWVNEILRTLLGWVPKQDGGDGDGVTIVSYGDDAAAETTIDGHGQGEDEAEGGKPPSQFDDRYVREDWRKVYADGPPDFIGKNNNYEPEFDRPVKLAVQRLVRSTKLEHKQLLKEVLGPYGFKGWKISQLTPNRTRRAAAVNWILHWYRSHYPEYEWK